MKIGFACDHAAVDLKNTLLEYLKGKGYECVDYGVNDPTKRVDYRSEEHTSELQSRQ